MQQSEMDFAEIYDQHKEMVFRVVLSLVGNVVDAEDVTQEAFIQVYKSLKSFSGQAKLSTWIYRIAVRVASKWLAKNANKQTIDFTHKKTENKDGTLNIDLLTALKKLPFNSRLVVGLILVQGLSHAEAAEVLNIPEGTVASRLSVAKGRLLSLLK